MAWFVVVFTLRNWLLLFSEERNERRDREGRHFAWRRSRFGPLFGTEFFSTMVTWRHGFRTLFETVDAISRNGRCHWKRSMPFLKLAEQTTALVNSSYAVGTLGRHFRAVLLIRWRSNPRARELSQLKQNEPILLVQKQKKNQLRSQRGGTPLCSQLRWVCFVFPEIFNHFQPG